MVHRSDTNGSGYLSTSNCRSMKISGKSIMLAGLGAAAGMAVMGAGVIHAATSTSTGTTPISNLVNAIATKFNLKTADVQQVFDQQRTQMAAQRTQDEKLRLDQAVKDGKITQAQEDLIIAKLAEQRAFRESLSGKTQAEREAAISANRTALQKWMTDNNIPWGYVPMGGGRGYRGMGGHYGMGMPPAAASSATSTSTTTN
jgi:hypothetical protein